MSSFGKFWLGKLIRPLGVSVVAALISGCSHAIPLKASVDRPPNINKLPLMIGVYYSPEFRTYQHARARGQVQFVAPQGQASAALFDQVLPMIFESVVPVPSRPPLAEASPKVAAVIEPKIEEFDFDFPWTPFGSYTAQIVYRLTLHSPEGTPFASWTVKGSGERGSGLAATHAPLIGEAVDLAMQDAAMKFMVGFRDIPEVRRWLRRVGVADAR